MTSLQILYEDDDLLVIDKPSGLLVHRGWGRDDVVLVDLVRDYTGAATVHPVHRLDRATSGVVLFARHPAAARSLGMAFDTQDVHKRYLALVRGVPKLAHQRVDHPLPRKEDGPRVPAATTVTRLGHVETEPRHLSLVLAEPHTGRPHQVRRHLKHINHPIIGDSKYGKNKLNRSFRESHHLERMALHACTLTLRHPSLDETMTFDAPLPPSLSEPLQRMGFAPELWMNLDSGLDAAVRGRPE